MSLKTMNGEFVDVGSGTVIAFYRESHNIVLLSKSGSTIRIMWPNGSDKLTAPSCIHSDDDFMEIVWVIASVLGLGFEKDKNEYSFGPAYVFVE